MDIEPIKQMWFQLPPRCRTAFLAGVAGEMSLHINEHGEEEVMHTARLLYDALAKEARHGRTRNMA